MQRLYPCNIIFFSHTFKTRYLEIYKIYILPCEANPSNCLYCRYKQDLCESRENSEKKVVAQNCYKSDYTHFLIHALTKMLK